MKVIVGCEISKVFFFLFGFVLFTYSCSPLKTDPQDKLAIRLHCVRPKIGERPCRFLFGALLLCILIRGVDTLQPSKSLR